MKQYKTVTVSRRVKLLTVHFVHNNVADITCKYKKRIRNKPPKPKVPDDASVIVSEDGNFIYRIEGRYWTCILTPQEQKLVRAVAAAKGMKLDGNDALKLFDYDKYGGDKLLRNMISHINRSLADRKIPLKLSFSDWYVQIIQNSMT